MILVYISLHLWHKSLVYSYQPTCSNEKFLFYLVAQLIQVADVVGYILLHRLIIYMFDVYVWMYMFGCQPSCCYFWKPHRVGEVLPIFLLIDLC
jgi:hypothetical protein